MSIDLNPLDWITNPTGTAESTAASWFNTPAVKAGAGATLILVGLAIFFAKKNAGTVRSVAMRYAPSVLPFAL